MRLSDIFTLLSDLFHGGLPAARDRINQINQSAAPYHRPVSPQAIWHIWAILGMIGVNYLILVHVPQWMEYWETKQISVNLPANTAVQWETEVWTGQTGQNQQPDQPYWLESDWGTEDSDGIFPVDIEPVPINIHSVRRQVEIPVSMRGRNTVVKIRAIVLVDQKGDYVRHRMPEHMYPEMARAVSQQVHKLSFLPALRDGKPVPYWTEVSLTFELR